MPDNPGEQLRHLLIVGRVTDQSFTNPQRTPGPEYANTPERGRPTSWSAAGDELSAGYGEEGNPKRLTFVSAGNVYLQRSDEFPARNETEQTHDPSHAWNAVSVGGFTDKAVISDQAYAAWQPLAPRGGLSPASSTSLIWDHDWPLKPDLVLEAGNRIVQPRTGDVDRHGDVEILTTNASWPSRLLTTTGDTSAATVEAARYAALIQPVEMRVTLSYFIEPNPGPRLPTNRYRYGSCSLRFDVRRSTESEAEFRARINAKERA